MNKIQSRDTGLDESQAFKLKNHRFERSWYKISVETASQQNNSEQQQNNSEQTITTATKTTTLLSTYNKACSNTGEVQQVLINLTE